VEDLLSTDPSPLGNVPTTISYWGNLKDIGLDYGWGPTAFFEHLVEFCYINAGLGWAGSIVLSSVMIRCGLFYFQMRASDAGAKLASMRPALQPIMDEMEAAKRNGDEEKAQAAKQKQAAIMKEAGGVDAMLSSLYMPVLQGVLGFGAFRCLRGMTNLPVPGLNSDGWLWFTDLTISDPFYLLPLTTGGIMYAIIKVRLFLPPI
jgi:YidC/Oxa1 family membrane protein insertase